MNEKRYWFPVRPARNGWGWGLPIVWQGWLAFALFLTSLIVGPFFVMPYGKAALGGYIAAVVCLWVGVLLVKGEPQSMRDTRNHAP